MNKITPAGHSRSVAKKDYISATDKISRELDTWLAMHPQERIRYFPSNLGSVSVSEVHAAILSRADRPYIAGVGEFVSHIYNALDDEIITYDLDIGLHNLGVGLRRNKILVNAGIAGNHLGVGSSGTILNTGKAGNFLGALSRGLVVDTGETGKGFHQHADGISLQMSADPYIIRLCSKKGSAAITKSGYTLIGSGKIIPDCPHDKFSAYIEDITRTAMIGGEEFDKRHGRNAAHWIEKALKEALEARQ